MSNFQQIPGSQATNLYANNLQIANNATTPNTQIDIAAGAARDSGNAYDIITTATITINAAVNGKNGLDTGSLAATKNYAVFVIADSSGKNTSGTLISLSATAPTLPFGYDVFRRIGWVRTDGSSHFLLYYVVGNGTHRTYYWDAMISVLSAGVQTSFTAIDLSAAVPAIDNTTVSLYASYTPATAANAASFRPTGSSATTVLDITGVVAAKAQDMQIKLLSKLASSLPKIDYKVANGSDALSLSVLGFEDYI